MNDVSVAMAFGAGFLSFFSPCILPLIPAYIMYITGGMMEEELKDRKMLALTRTFGFVLGFTIIFMILGISASYIGKMFMKNREIFTKLSGLLIIIFGLNMTGIIELGALNKEVRFKAPKKMTNWFSAILMGMAFAAGWTPCIGVVLGTILIYASTTATVSAGVYLLLAYSVGMAIPFLLTALLINQFGKFLLKSEKALLYITKLGGVIIVLFGILMTLNKLSIFTNLFI